MSAKLPYSISVEERPCLERKCKSSKPNPACPRCGGRGVVTFFIDSGNFDADYRSRLVTNSIQFYWNKQPFMSVNLQTGKALLAIPFERAAALFWEVLTLSAAGQKTDTYVVEYQGMPVFKVNVRSGAIRHVWQDDEVIEFFERLEKAKPERT